MKPTLLSAAEFAVTTYFHIASVGTAPDEVTDPEYWAHVAALLRTGNRVEVLAEDGAWWGMLIVRAAGATDAQVQWLSLVPLGQESADLDTSPYEVKWRGPKALWGVVRKSDAAVLQDKFPVREQAEEWLLGHLKAMAV
jgi:hypothetical protein